MWWVFAAVVLGLLVFSRSFRRVAGVLILAATVLGAVAYVVWIRPDDLSREAASKADTDLRRALWQRLGDKVEVSVDHWRGFDINEFAWDKAKKTGVYWSSVTMDGRSCSVRLNLPNGSETYNVEILAGNISTRCEEAEKQKGSP
jgi:hypothetical protein